jgi:hypothetical protein
MKKLPIGIQSFEDLRSNDYLYVDKTEIIYRIISSGKVYFLSRPRRFGKSLLVSTMEAIFKGKKELFEGLYIYDHWDWSQQYPVIRIDWTLISHSAPEEMKTSMCRYLRRIAEGYEITLSGETASDCFDELILRLYRQTGKKVVVLIDEYDKPVTSHLFDAHLDNIRRMVHDFYQVMKGADEHLQFVFLTGVSNVFGAVVFSALNQLNDISLDKPFTAICGYTQEELESNFPEYIDSAAESLEMTREHLLERIRYWYDGYPWDGKTSIYNPFSMLLFFFQTVFFQLLVQYRHADFPYRHYSTPQQYRYHAGTDRCRRKCIRRLQSAGYGRCAFAVPNRLSDHQTDRTGCRMEETLR